MADRALEKAPAALNRRILRWLMNGVFLAALGWWLGYLVISHAPVGISTGMESLVPLTGGVALCLPGLAYLAWSFDRHAPGGSFKLAGRLIGLVVPIAAFFALLSVMPHGD